MRAVVILAAAGLGAGAVSAAKAQTFEPGASVMRMEVWNGSAWTQSVAGTPGGRVEYRVVVSYTGAQSVFGLASGRYQLTFSNADIFGIQDENLGFRGGGQSGDAFPGTTLTQAEGQSGAALPSYGRVGFSSNSMTGLNLLWEHEHFNSFPTVNVPPGDWLRLAGATAAWPAPTLSQAQTTVANLNNIARGIAMSQLPSVNPLTNGVNTFYIAGSQNLVVFRGALQLGDLTNTRTISIGIAEGSLLRWGGANNPDDRRYIDWHTSATGGSHRTGVIVQTASITIPTPGAVGLLGFAGAFATRRRRRLASVRRCAV